ncbi:hypothetical protein LCGC14_1867090 [marine sediment metagenome]|uniref:Uncharacterized protein n=1 Tax=marine sediment metagenome TaxID=412755 RepID=A0A0F9IK50_9ZZZZ
MIASDDVDYDAFRAEEKEIRELLTSWVQRTHDAGHKRGPIAVALIAVGVYEMVRARLFSRESFMTTMGNTWDVVVHEIASQQAADFLEHATGIKFR